MVSGGGNTTVDLAFAVSDRTATGGTLYNAEGSWLGTFQIQSSDNTLIITSVPARPVTPVGGTISPTTGVLRVDFDGAVVETVWAKLALDPEILIEYQDRDLVYTELLNPFDD